MSLLLADPSPLSSYQWKNRVLVISAGLNREDMLREQMALFESNQAGLAERDLVCFQFFAQEGLAPDGRTLTKEDTEAIRKQLGLPSIGFTVVLIGKDGGLKLKKTSVLTTEELFAVIDAMPMRQSEMKRKGNP